MNFNFILPQRIIFGAGSIKKIGEESVRLGGRKVLIVTSKGMLKREPLKQVANRLREHHLSFEVFFRVSPEPPMENVQDCTAFAKETGCDLLIGLGGGSAMDVAKKVASDMGLPRIMVPTTAGTGSEVTHESVFKVDGKKKALVDESLVPDVAIVDPDLTRTVPPRLAASSGIDALAHAIECYTSKKSNPPVKALALEAYTIIKGNLRKAMKGDKEARINMALGSLLAGMAFGNSGTALAHALSYPLSNRGISHGESVALVLPYALEFNDFDKDVIDEVKCVIRETGLSARFEGDVAEMAAIVMTDERHLANNPREVTLDDVLRIFERMKEEYQER